MCSRPPPGSCFVSCRALRSRSHARLGGPGPERQAAPRVVSRSPCSCSSISFPFSFLGFGVTSGVSSAASSRAPGWRSGLRSCSPKVGSARVWGPTWGKAAVFIFVFPPLPPARRRPHPRFRAMQLPGAGTADRASSVASPGAARKQGGGGADVRAATPGSPLPGPPRLPGRCDLWSPAGNAGLARREAEWESEAWLASAPTCPLGAAMGFCVPVEHSTMGNKVSVPGGDEIVRTAGRSCAPRALHVSSYTPPRSRGVNDYPHFTEDAEAGRGRTTC